MATPPDTPEARLAALAIELPAPPTPVAAYVPWRRAGALLFISGQIPLLEGRMMALGRVPTPVDVETARRCARHCVLNGLAVVRSALGSLDAVGQVVRLGVFVACEGDFTRHPEVANGASELLEQVFGEAGRHARSAIGCPSLPLNAPVEVELTIEVSAQPPKAFL